jgi:hypothetical protein
MAFKQGATVFVLDSKEQRKAALMSRPGSDGSNAFARLLTAQTVYRDPERLPPVLRQPAAVQHSFNAPHDSACVLTAMNDLVAAMLMPAPADARAN